MEGDLGYLQLGFAGWLGCCELGNGHVSMVDGFEFDFIGFDASDLRPPNILAAWWNRRDVGVREWTL